MYLLTVNVPVFRSGADLQVHTPWKRGLLLLRDSLRGKYGPIGVVAPELPASLADEQKVETIRPDEGIELFGSYDPRGRARQFWTRERKRWRADVARLLPRARVVHDGLVDIWKPSPFLAHLQAVRAGVPTVFVEDTDIVQQLHEQAATQTGLTKMKTRATAWFYDRALRKGVKTATVSLLKGGDLMRKYGALGHARLIHDTAHTLADIIPADVVEKRLATRGTSLRLVYCGRLIERKGVVRSVEMVAHARSLGADVRLDLIGDGPQRDEVVRAAAAAGNAVRHLGLRSYGPELVRELATYDAMLFTPPIEDTPRMIFDGYAAGLPLLGSPIAYIKERVAEERAGVLLPPDARGGGETLAHLAADPASLVAVTRSALTAAREHAAESWYARRAEWTMEAVDAWEWNHPRRV